MAAKKASKPTPDSGHRPKTRSMSNSSGASIESSEEKQPSRKPKSKSTFLKNADSDISKQETATSKPPSKKAKPGGKDETLGAFTKGNLYDLTGDALELNALGEAGRDITREALFLEGWDTKHLPPHLRHCSVADHCRLPSPLADGTDRHGELPAAISDHVHKGVRYSFELIYKYRESLRARLINRKRVSNDGVDGKLCALAIKGKGKGKAGAFDDCPINIYDWPDETTEQKRIEINELISAENDTVDFGASKVLTIRRLPSSEHGFGYFIINTNLELLAVNESAIGLDMIAGPLPEFAIITVGHKVLFWWRTAAALEYIPTLQGIKRKLEDEAVVKASEQLTWEQLLDQGLNNWRTVHRSNHKKDPKKHMATISESRNWGEDEVILAIASVWEGLRNQGYLFGYAGQDVFTPLGDQFDQYGVVGGQNKFIMPLILPSADQNQAKRDLHRVTEVGHILLGVAGIDRSGSGKKGDTSQKKSEANGGDKKKADEREPQVKVTLYNSRIHDGDQYCIDQKVRRLVNIWLNVNKVNINYVQKAVPTQGVKSNACGFHTVLSAWAVMLDIPIAVNRRRRHHLAEFYEQGRELVNLALAGCMDTRTIQAFMNEYGFSVVQDPNNAADSVVAINASRMDIGKLPKCIRQQRDAERLTAFSESDEVVSDEDIAAIRQVLSRETSDDEIIWALIVSAFDANEAVERLISRQPSPSPPAQKTTFSGAEGSESGGTPGPSNGLK